MDTIDWLLGISLKSEQLSWWQMCDRAIVMYIALIAVVRLGKKRSLGRATAFDVVLMIIVGSMAARAITGGAPFGPALAALVVVVGMHWCFSWGSLRSSRFGSLIKGSATPIIEGGKLRRKAMNAAHISDDDLEEDLREKGVETPSDVKSARLERSGRLSVIKN
jgi:uncharacterized membrane protein YcaP (DUF421 family)